MGRTMTVEQSYHTVNAIYEQATGRKGITVTDLTSFSVVASGIRQLSYNQIIPAMMEMLSDLRVDERVWSPRYQIVWNSEEEYGAHVAVVSFLDNADAQANPEWALKDGDKIGTHTVKLPKVYERDFSGLDTIMADITICKDQIKTCFDSPGQLAKFYSGLITNIENQLRQQKEDICKAVVCNHIAGLYSYLNTPTAEMKRSVVHLVSDYDKKFGKKYTNISGIRAVPADYEQFIKFCYARVNDVAALMGNRDKLFHVNPTNDPQCAGTTGIIMRHSAPSDLRCIVCREYISDIETQVLSSVRNLEYLKTVPYEETLYWQSVETPTQVNVKGRVFKDTGKVEDVAATPINDVFALLYDKDALGVGVYEDDEWVTQFDPEKKAQNRGWNLTVKPWNDFTHKSALFLMDTEPGYVPGK